MEIKEIQKKALEAVKIRLSKNNVSPNTDLILTHLMEEMGEIATQINNGKLKRKDVDIHNIGEEISDCVILLMTLADHYNIDFEKALLEKIEEVKSKTK